MTVLSYKLTLKKRFRKFHEQYIINCDSLRTYFFFLIQSYFFLNHGYHWPAGSKGVNNDYKLSAENKVRPYEFFWSSSETYLNTVQVTRRETNTKIYIGHGNWYTL